VTRYAARTSVPVDKSRTEIERVLERYGASGFGYAWDRREEKICDGCTRGPAALASCLADHGWHVRSDTRELIYITFKLNDRAVRLDVPMPTATEAGSKERLEQHTRERWRALVLVLKAKLEAVASGISTLEQEFLANMVMRDGRTIGQAMLHRIPEVCETGRLLPPAGGTT
jgi:hypothetical protein